MKIYRLSILEFPTDDPDQFDDYDDSLPSDKYDDAFDIFTKSKIRFDSTKDIKDIVLSDGVVVGATASGWSTIDDTAEFSFDVVVKEEHRGVGIGTQLIERAMQMFQSERFNYEDMNLKTIMKLEVVNLPLGDFLINKYGFKVLMKQSDRIFLSLE